MSVRAVRVAGGVLIVAVVLFAVWAGIRDFSARTPAAVLRVPVAASGATEEFDSAAPEPLLPPPQIPQNLPEFALADRTGKPTPVSTWRGKSLILNFWATWCAPCRREIPLLGSLHDQWADRGVEVVGVAIDDRRKVAAYADEMKITYPLLIGEEDALDVAAQLGVASPVFPFSVFTDRRGEVVTLYLGELHPAQAALILSVVQDLNQNRLSLPAARQAIADGLQGLSTKHPG
jgi:peroxiredoxin